METALFDGMSCMQSATAIGSLMWQSRRVLESWDMLPSTDTGMPGYSIRSSANSPADTCPDLGKGKFRGTLWIQLSVVRKSGLG